MRGSWLEPRWFPRRAVCQRLDLATAKAPSPLAGGVSVFPLTLRGHILLGKAFGATHDDVGTQGQGLRGFRPPRRLPHSDMLLVRRNQGLHEASWTREVTL